MTSLFEGAASWEAIAFAVVATLAVSWFAALLVKALALAALTAVAGEQLAPSSPMVSAPLRVISAGAFVLFVSLALFPALELTGLRPRRGIHFESIAVWALDDGVRLLLVVLIAYALVRIIALMVKRFEHRVSQGTSLDALERGKRARTLGSMISKVATIAIWSVALLMVLDKLDVNIAPVLTGAGIAGLAVGFGAQTLVRDVISGFFLILEDQVRVGDIAAINGIGGLVEQLNLRTIVLRDEEGTVHVFPNGAITTLANKSKDYSAYVMTLSIPYHEDIDRVVSILTSVGAELQNDQRLGPFILEPLDVYGVEAFTDFAVQLKMRIKTVPQQQYAVGRELRRRIRQALDEQGVAVPFPVAVSQAPGPMSRPPSGD